MEIYFIRHGQSTNNRLTEANWHTRSHDPELTEIGHKQAARVAEYLCSAPNLEDIVRVPDDAPERERHYPHTLTHLYCSPMYRALQTMQPIAKALNINPTVWIDVHEVGGIHYDKDGETIVLGGKTRTEIMTEFPNYALPDAITDEGWYKKEWGREDWAGCLARAFRVSSALVMRAENPRSQDDKIAIVSHGGFINAILKALTNIAPNPRLDFWHYNTAITRVDLEVGGTMVIRYINRVTHLTPDLLT